MTRWIPPNARRVRQYLALLKKHPKGPSKAVHDRYTWSERFEAVYRLTHKGKHRPRSDLDQ